MRVNKRDFFVEHLVPGVPKTEAARFSVRPLATRRLAKDEPAGR